MPTEKIQSLFFTPDGGGPDEVQLYFEPVRGDEVMPAMLGLRVEVNTPMMFASPGGYLIDRTAAIALRDGLNAWLARDNAVARLREATVCPSCARGDHSSHEADFGGVCIGCPCPEVPSAEPDETPTTRGGAA
jgi:hypothetical protein